MMMRGNVLMNYKDLAEKLSLYTIKKVPIDNVLPDLLQPRKRYDPRGIDELSEKMKKNGLISFPLAEIITGKEYKEYLKGTDKENPDSQAHRDFHTCAKGADGYAKQLLLSKICSNRKYYFLVVGHRRLLAAKKAGFSHIKLKVLKGNLSLLERRIVQIDEDSMLHPPAWQNAKATYDLYKLFVKDRQERGIKERYTFREYANYLGISESTVREHIKYARLPQSIKNLVEKQKSLKYQNALQIARLRNEEEQLRIALCYGSSPTKKLNKIISSMLEKKKKQELKLEQQASLEINRLLHEKIAYLYEVRREVYRTTTFCSIDPNYKKWIYSRCKNDIKSLFKSYSKLEREINKITNNRLSKLEKIVPLNGKKQNNETIDKIIFDIENEKANENPKKEILSEEYLRYIDVNSIKENRNNPRGNITEEEIDALAAAIKRDGGLLNPVLVKKQKDGYLLEFGHRRVRAAKKAGLDKISAFVVDEIPRSLALDLQIMENTQVPFSEEERAYGLAQIYDLAGKNSVDEFIAELGISRKTGLMALKYQKCLDPFVKSLVENGLLSYSASLLLTQKKSDEQKSLALIAAANRFTKEKMANLIEEREALKNQQTLFEGINSCAFEYSNIAEEFSLILKNLENEIAVISSRHKDILKRNEFIKEIFKTKKAFKKLRSALA